MVGYITQAFTISKWSFLSKKLHSLCILDIWKFITVMRVTDSYDVMTVWCHIVVGLSSQQHSVTGVHVWRHQKAPCVYGSTVRTTWPLLLFRISTASACVTPTRLSPFTARIWSPCFRRPSSTAAPCAHPQQPTPGTVHQALSQTYSTCDAGKSGGARQTGR